MARPLRPVTKDDIGLKVLCQPPISDESTIDIIAVHTIGVHPDDTWYEGVGAVGDAQRREVNWLCDPDLLPAVAPQARIMRYGYRCRRFGKDDLGGPVCLKVSAVADMMLRDIMSKRETTPDRPLIFLAHGFGGLVVMRALRNAFDDPATWHGVFVSTTGLVFFGTPFRGAAGYNQKEMVEAALTIYPPEEVLGRSLHMLTPGDETLEDLLDRFLEMRSRSNPARVACFYEIKSSNVGAIVGVRDRHAFVVNERAHFDVHTFGKPSEMGFRFARDVLERMIDGSTGLISARNKRHIEQMAPQASALIGNDAQVLQIENLFHALMPSHPIRKAFVIPSLDGRGRRCRHTIRSRRSPRIQRQPSQ